MPAFLAPLAIAGISAAAGALSGRKQTQTQKSRTKKVLTPGQQQAEGLLTQQMLQKVNNPTEGLEPFRTAGYAGVNRNFAGAMPRLEQTLSSRGFARGGQMSGGARQIELGRINALSGVDSEMATRAIGERDKGLSIATDLLSQVNEQETEGNMTTPGNMLSGAVNNGVSTFSMLQTLSRMMAQPAKA